MKSNPVQVIHQYDKQKNPSSDEQVFINKKINKKNNGNIQKKIQQTKATPYCYQVFYAFIILFYPGAQKIPNTLSLRHMAAIFTLLFIFPGVLYAGQDKAICPPFLAQWQTQNYEQIKNRTIKEIVFPGTHHSGMYQSQQCTLYANSCNTKTQQLNITEQLNCGIRFFDLRLYLNSWNDDISAGHFAPPISVIGRQGCYGESLDEILTQLSDFAKKNPKELIIVNIITKKGLKPFFNSSRTVVIDKIKKYFSQFQGYDSDTPYHELLNKGNIMLLTYDNLFKMEINLEQGRKETVNYYIDTNNYEKLKEEQIKRLNSTQEEKS